MNLDLILTCSLMNAMYSKDMLGIAQLLRKSRNKVHVIFTFEHHLLKWLSELKVNTLDTTS